VVFRVPKASYSSATGLGQQKLEFKKMVQAFHKAGIEVILDLVFQPHRRGRRAGTDALLSRDRQQNLLHAGG